MAAPTARASRLPFLALAPLLVALLTACGDGPDADGDDGPAPRPHIVCVLVDQLRMDSFERWAPKTTALGRQGVHAARMRSAAPWTYPSVISLFSGLYPQQHGADGEQASNKLRTFDSELPLLHEILKAEGYTTAAFVTNPFFHDWNSFHEGFDTYDIHFIGSQGDKRGNAKRVWRPSMFANTVNDTLDEHFRDRPLTGPEFTYVHYIDVHGPWDDAPFPATYEDSIAWIDEKIVALYESMRQRYDDDLLFFVTSDHGVALEDDMEVGSGPQFRKSKASVHDFNIRIPFLVLPSRHITTPRTIDEACSNIDFVPTILDWLDIPPQIPLPGKSLMPAIRSGTPGASDRVLYARNSAFGAASDCIVQDERKSIRFFDPLTHERLAQHSYELDDDPRETASLGEDPWGVAAALRKAEGSHGIAFQPMSVEVGRDVQSDLRALGYLK